MVAPFPRVQNLRHPFTNHYTYYFSDEERFKSNCLSTVLVTKHLLEYMLLF